MSTKLVNVDRATPMLLAVDLREWEPADDVVNLVVEAVGEMDLSSALVNERGSGSAQYPPGMMLALLIYSYSQGLQSSRRIERATPTHVGVRYVTGDTHPDHDTMARFRRGHGALLRSAFVEVLQLARRLGVPHTVVADRGYDNQPQIEAVRVRTGAAVCVPPQLPGPAQRHRPLSAARQQRLAHLQSPWGRRLQTLRRCVIEPVFGTLKHTWRFNRFELRGREGVQLEWLLLCTAYNLRKLQRLTAAAA